ncbi:MAG: DHHA1 domain-containing protein [Halothiobacillaceae bacterium]
MTTPTLPNRDVLLFHLSHNDLDGYGAQYMTRAAGFRARYYNADYRDVSVVLERIFADMAEVREPSLLLITDLNLTAEQADMVDSCIQSMGEATTSRAAPPRNSLLTPEMAAMLRQSIGGTRPKPKVMLLDHHATGEDAAAKHAWYHLDTSRCASRLAFEAVAPYLDDAARALYAAQADFIDVGDRWLKGDARFHRSIFLMGLMMEDDQIAPSLDELKREYRFHLMEAFFRRMEEGASLEALERAVYDFRKDFLKGRVDAGVYADSETPLKDKFHKLSARMLPEGSVPMLLIDGYRTGIFFSWPPDVFRGVVTELMENQGKMDMAIRVSGNGRLSLRSNDGVDVGIIAGRYFEGGGHPGAAGGVLKDTRLKDVNQAIRAISQAIVERKGEVKPL